MSVNVIVSPSGLSPEDLETRKASAQSCADRCRHRIEIKTRNHFGQVTAHLVADPAPTGLRSLLRR